jgi:hypothetical protein
MEPISDASAAHNAQSAGMTPRLVAVPAARVQTPQQLDASHYDTMIIGVTEIRVKLTAVLATNLSWIAPTVSAFIDALGYGRLGRTLVVGLLLNLSEIHRRTLLAKGRHRNVTPRRLMGSCCR